IAREQLARLTGEYTEELNNLTEAFPLMRPEPMDPSAWEQTAIGQNWQVQSAIYELNSTEANLKTAKSGHMPTLDLGASWSESEIDDFDGLGIRDGTNEGTQRQISLTLNVPLYMGGGTQ